MSEQLVGVVCQLQRSTYEEERVFRFTMADGREYVGIAPRHYCHRPNGDDIHEGEPGPGAFMEGVVDARLVQNGGDTAKVSLPTGETIVVPAASVRHRKLVREAQYVLSGP